MKKKKKLTFFLILLFSGIILIGLSFLFASSENGNQIYTIPCENELSLDISLKNCKVNLISVSAGESFAEISENGGLFSASFENGIFSLDNNTDFSNLVSDERSLIGFGGISGIFSSLFKKKDNTVNIFISEKDELLSSSLSFENCEVRISGINSILSDVKAENSIIISDSSASSRTFLSLSDCKFEYDSDYAESSFDIKCENENGLSINGKNYKEKTQDPSSYRFDIKSDSSEIVFNLGK